jgi:hypothetical protein
VAENLGLLALRSEIHGIAFAVSRVAISLDDFRPLALCAYNVASQPNSTKVGNTGAM